MGKDESMHLNDWSEDDQSKWALGLLRELIRHLVNLVGMQGSVCLEMLRVIQCH